MLLCQLPISSPLHRGTSRAIILRRLQRTSRLRLGQVQDTTKPSSFSACRSPPEFGQSPILESEPAIMHQCLQIAFAIQSDPARLPAPSSISQSRRGLTRGRVRPRALGLSVPCESPCRILCGLLLSCLQHCLHASPPEASVSSRPRTLCMPPFTTRSHLQLQPHSLVPAAAPSCPTRSCLLLPPSASSALQSSGRREPRR
jgi:hypothetical protein